MVNQSKINDPRFWKKWRESGAVRKPLERGETYHLDTDSPFYTGHGVTYVRKEKFKDGSEWETFYSYVGGTLLSCSEGLVRMDGTLQRLRIPANNIQGISRGVVRFNGELVSRLIQDPSARTPLVESWLKEVEEIQAA